MGKALRYLLVCVMTALVMCGAASAALAEEAGGSDELATDASGTTIVYRLYNPATSEHLWTTDYNEYTVLSTTQGWNAEGQGWTAPASGKPVYRLYNPAIGSHHYTASASEIAELVANQGWVYDNDDKQGNHRPVFYSAEVQDEGGKWVAADLAKPIYRLYNENIKPSQHHLSTSKSEYDKLAGMDWNQEGITFYAVGGGTDGVKVGDIVIFGSYEQDGKASNGKEAIEWRVLAVKDGQALLVSEKGLDCKPYNQTCTGVSWKTCTLRSWLNSTFYNAAFTSAEQAVVCTTTVSNGNDPSTDDKVFLLSVNDLKSYLPSNNDRICAPTAYAVERGVWQSLAYKVGGAGACCWLLRGWSNGAAYAVYVNADGSVDTSNGYYVDASSLAVRPALWVNL